MHGSTASIHATSAASSLFATYDRERREKGEMILKIQAPMDEPKVHMLAYNEDRSFQCFLDMEKLDAGEVLALLEAKGMYGTKAYFSAFLRKGRREVVLIPDTFQYELPW